MELAGQLRRKIGNQQIEEVIRKNQQEYYNTLELSDNSGSSTCFIEFMLNVINEALRNTIKESTPTTTDYTKRIEYALSKLDNWFDRKEYLNVCKGISTATASRDLKQLLEDGLIESTGTRSEVTVKSMFLYNSGALLSV